MRGGKVVQRHVLYLGEINDSQEIAWRKTLEIFSQGALRPQTLSLFPEDRSLPIEDETIVRIRLKELKLKRPRQWGACWLACHVYEQLKLDLVLEHKRALFDHLTRRWKDLFNTTYEVLLYDLTSTYFESDPSFAENDKRKFGYSRDKRSDCVQVIVALIVTPEGFALAYQGACGKHQ